MKKLYLILAMVVLSFSQSLGQYKVVEGYAGSFRVNSSSKIGGKTRNIISAEIPPNAIGYVIRAYVLSKNEKETSLLEELRNEIIGKAASFFTNGLSNLASFAINSIDNKNLDFYLFDNKYDAQKFKNTRSSVLDHVPFSYCEHYQNHINIYLKGNKCTKRGMLYVGLRNRNIRKGLDVRLDIDFIVKTNTYQQTARKTTNPTNSLKYNFVGTAKNDQNSIDLTGSFKIEPKTLKVFGHYKALGYTYMLGGKVSKIGKTVMIHLKEYLKGKHLANVMLMSSNSGQNFSGSINNLDGKVYTLDIKQTQ